MGLSSPQSTTILTDVSQLILQHTQTLNFELFVTFLHVYSAFSSLFQFEKYTYSTVQYSTVQYMYSTVQYMYSTVQYMYSTVQYTYSTVQYSICTVQYMYSTVQYSICTVQPTFTCPHFKITLHLTFNFSAPKLIISELNFCHLQFSSVFKSTTSNECARFQIITAVMTQMKACLEVMPCQLVKQSKMGYLTLQMEAPHSSSQFATIFQLTWHNIPEQVNCQSYIYL